MAKVELSTARGKLHQDISEMLIFTNQRVSPIDRTSDANLRI